MSNKEKATKELREFMYGDENPDYSQIAAKHKELVVKYGEEANEVLSLEIEKLWEEYQSGFKDV